MRASGSGRRRSRDVRSEVSRTETIRALCRARVFLYHVPTMEPKKQVEIQLGHMCNNRCVFCVSGQDTALGRARPLGTAPILAEISRAHADAHRKITLLGGEPTLQPGFLDVVRHAVAL